ncbi:MAG: polyprenyl diphosphate synthase [Gammaproteobacteria bacterium]
MLEHLVSSKDRPLAHIAIIMDGNGRWAKLRGLPRSAGHHRGAKAVRRAISGAIKLGVPYLTLYGFSAENWQRPPPEVNNLMGLLRRYLQSDLAELHAEEVRFQVIGQRERLPSDIAQLISDAEELTRHNDRLTLTLALSYGGRQEILAAARFLACEVTAGRIDPMEIDLETFSGCLMTSNMPDPDLLIRTGGEQRISNFLLWQLANTRVVFMDALWPDFSEEHLVTAIREHQDYNSQIPALADVY